MNWVHHPATEYPRQMLSRVVAYEHVGSTDLALSHADELELKGFKGTHAEPLQF